jgi:hypothetical protein
MSAPPPPSFMDAVTHISLHARQDGDDGAHPGNEAVVMLTDGALHGLPGDLIHATVPSLTQCGRHGFY